MEIVLMMVIYSVSIAISTGVLGVSLFLIEDNKESSFQIDGRAVTWAKCAGLVVVTTLLGLLPFGPWLRLIAIFVGVMALFQKSFGQTFFLLIINGLFSFGVMKAIGWIIEQVSSSS